MISSPVPLDRCRRAATLLALAGLLAPTTAVQGQRLLTLVGGIGHPGWWMPPAVPVEGVVRSRQSGYYEAIEQIAGWRKHALHPLHARSHP